MMNDELRSYLNSHILSTFFYNSFDDRMRNFKIIVMVVSQYIGSR